MLSSRAQMNAAIESVEPSGSCPVCWRYCMRSDFVEALAVGPYGAETFHVCDFCDMGPDRMWAWCGTYWRPATSREIEDHGQVTEYTYSDHPLYRPPWGRQ